MATNRLRFALHPGNVISKNDGDVHFISAPRLAELYNLPPGSWFSWKSHGLGRERDNYVHLYPRRDGNYPDLNELKQPSTSNL